MAERDRHPWRLDDGNRPEMVMCRSCGKFVTAVESGGTFEPFYRECPDCGGTSFKHNGSGRVVETR